MCVPVPVQEATGESEDPRPAAGWIVYLNPVTGEMHSVSARVCLNERALYKQLEWGFSLGGSYVQMPVTEETGMQGLATRQTECMTPAAGWIHIVCIYFPLTDLHLDLPRVDSRMKLLVLLVFM